MLTLQAEDFRNEVLYCSSCKRSVNARIATWIDASRTPRVKTLLLNWEFNMVICPQCGYRLYSDSPFFYEDFAEGLLVAVFPSIPNNHLSVEEHIRQEYGYYPTLEFFYDMTQLWFLIYLQEYYKTNVDLLVEPIFGGGEERLRMFLRFLKKDPMMLTIREMLTKSFLGIKTNDDLQNVLWYALVKLEGMSSGLSESSGLVRPGARGGHSKAGSPLRKPRMRSRIM
ncbi:MAG TPA: CpXC domain-containing protein [Nitrospirota bacterium]|nr:CpXC domain-containing protein [Nitrospirota bacterium]